MALRLVASDRGPVRWCASDTATERVAVLEKAPSIGTSWRQGPATARAAEVDASFGLEAATHHDARAKLAPLSIDGRFTSAREFAARANEAAPELSPPHPHLAPRAKLVGQPDVAGDLGVVEVQ